MKFFADTASIEGITALAEVGMIDGVTTNPSLIAKSGRDFKEVIAEICGLVDGPVSAEVAATDFPDMVSEGSRLSEIAENVVVKLPLTWHGLRACRHFKNSGIQTSRSPCKYYLFRYMVGTHISLQPWDDHLNAYKDALPYKKHNSRLGHPS